MSSCLFLCIVDLKIACLGACYGYVCEMVVCRHSRLYLLHSFVFLGLLLPVHLRLHDNMKGRAQRQR
jgi:hypothetical protein